MGLICDNPCWPTKCFSHDTKIWGLLHTQHGWVIHLIPPSCPRSVLETMPLLSCCSLNLLSVAKPKHPKGQDAFLRESRTYWADGRHGDLGSLVFNHHCLNPLLLTHSLTFAKSLVSGTAHVFPRVVVRAMSAQNTGGGLLKMLCLIRAFSVEVLAGVKIVLIVSVGVW